MKQNLYLILSLSLTSCFSIFGSEYYRESIITGLMAEPQMKILTLEKNYGYTLERSRISHVVNLSYENQENHAETYMAVFDQEGMVTYSCFHKGPNAGQLLVYLEDPTKKPLKGQAADFNYLKKRYLDSIKGQ